MAAGGPFHLLGLDAEWWVSPVSKDWLPAARATQEKNGSPALALALAHSKRPGRSRAPTSCVGGVACGGVVSGGGVAVW